MSNSTAGETTKTVNSIPSTKRPPLNCAQCREKPCAGLFRNRADHDRLWMDRAKSFRVGRQYVAAHAPSHLEGDPPGAVAILYDGWALTYQTLADGRRHVLDILIPGDIIRLPSTSNRRMNFGCEAITPATACTFQLREIRELSRTDPEFSDTLYRLREEECEAQITRETNLACRNAEERVIFFLLHMYWRLRRRGFTRGTECFFPVTQTALGDATGLALGNVNRILGRLRKEGLIDLSNRWLRVHDERKLAARADLPYHDKVACPPCRDLEKVPQYA